MWLLENSKTNLECWWIFNSLLMPVGYIYVKDLTFFNAVVDILFCFGQSMKSYAKSEMI